MMDLAKLHLHWRASQYKGKSYRSYSLAYSYRENGKNRKKIVIKLGKLTDSEAKKWRCLLMAIKKPDTFLTTAEDIVVTRHYAYLDVAVVNAVWDEWGLDSVFSDSGKSKRDLKISTIARILTVNRSIDPAAKSQTPEWFRKTALPWLPEADPAAVNSSRIFRDPAFIENCKEAICKYLFARMKYDNPDSVKSVFYDLSSTSFSGTRCVLSKWGYCKDGYHMHAVLALVVSGDGLPFYWEVLPGGTADSKTIVWLLGRLEDRFGCPETTLTFDRGMVSDDNLNLLEDAEIKYVSAMDKNQLEKITGIDFALFSHLTPEDIGEQVEHLTDFTKFDDTAYYQEIGINDKRRHILCFNPEMFKDQRKAREQAVSDFHEFTGKLNAELYEAKKSRQRKPTYGKFRQRLIKTKLNSFTDVSLRVIHVKQETGGKSVRTYKAAVITDDTAMRKAGKLDGFRLLVTNRTNKKEDKFEMSPTEVIRLYRDKAVIESAFRDIKSFVEVKPVYVWTEQHVRAHYTFCVLSYLINRTITLRLHKNKGHLTEEIVTHEKLYEKLSDCQTDNIEVENVRLSTYNMTRPTPEQKELLDRVGLTELLSHEIVKKARACRPN